MAFPSIFPRSSTCILQIGLIKDRGTRGKQAEVYQYTYHTYKQENSVMSDSKDGWNADFQQHFTDEEAEVQGQAGVHWPLTAQARTLHCFGSP